MSVYQTLSPEQQQLMCKHLELVIEANKTVNLTRIDSLEEGMTLHVEDSLVGLQELNDCEEGDYADLGSGAGFPGIPLAIATGRKTTLVDARQKKMKTVESIISELGLSGQVETFSGRAELLARSQPERYVALTARALAQLSVLLELASPLLKRGGRLICYKANIEESELTHAESVQRATGMKLKSTRELLLEGKYHRTIMTFEKVAKPTVKLPRLEGQAQKKPL